MLVQAIQRVSCRLKAFFQRRAEAKFKKRIGKDVWPDPLPEDYLIKKLEKKRKKRDGIR
jgi:hypothetical protein